MRVFRFSDSFFCVRTFLERVEIAEQQAEIRIRSDALLVRVLERRDGLAELRLAAELDRADAIPGQGALARALADFFGADRRRHGDVGLHAAMLRALASDAVVLADRDGELAEAGSGPSA